MTFYVAFASASGGYRRSRLLINNVVQETEFVLNNNGWFHHTSRRYAVTAGDQIKVQVYQDAGTVNFYDTTTTGMVPILQCRWWAS